ncbi:MAG: hypothetical protein GAK35_02761 [Herbaspirillum frisingense]|uniref:Bacterial toxin YdaT domain-containing protein n=1 Tax=Herbaspirillum frisingense TaxID=92645 RepID=A0A7V8FVI8_9BURK|nr:MAG: hypothetical protein GAK35_02761 [Herbaspirillum frisingense]
MRNETHTLISIVAAYVDMWRKRIDASRETVAVLIVEAHERIAGPANTGIRFEPPTQDSFTRSRVMAERIFRWLDDRSKDSNLLPINFLLSILVAMPADIRLRCINDMLAPLKLVAGSMDADLAGDMDAVRHLAAVAKESAEAIGALGLVVAAPTLPAMEAAVRELDEAIESKRSARRALRGAILKLRGAGSRFMSVVRKGAGR